MESVAVSAMFILISDRLDERKTRDARMQAVIRKEALNTFSLMLEQVSKDDLVNIVIPTIITINPKKLFTSKLASLDLMVAVYPIC